MAEILSGKPVANAINEKASVLCATLKENGITPVLAIIRVGEKPDDITYENSATRAIGKVGAEVKKITLPEDIDNDSFLATVRDAAFDSEINGILLLRPLPKGLDEKTALALIPPAKDVDGCSSGSFAGVYSGSGEGFLPCTAQAVTEILDYYDIDCSGKRATVLGRSLVIGRPAAMLLLERNATVTICHSKTRDAASIASSSDILVTAMGRARSVGSDYFSEGQVVIDVSICVNPDTGKLCGDMKQEEAEETVGAFTPVPGGVGTVTSSILALHVVQAAAAQSR